MSFPIDPFRRSPGVRPAKTPAAESPDGDDNSAEAAALNLPVPVSPARTLPPKAPVGNSATIEAQKLGERRGLRAGAAAITAAKTTYTRTEWSGSKDRRAPKGRSAKTDI
jgi:hypothetical protein